MNDDKAIALLCLVLVALFACSAKSHESSAGTGGTISTAGAPSSGGTATISGGASTTTSGGASTTTSGGATTTTSGGATATTSGGATATTSGGASTSCASSATYDAIVLCDHPIGYWAMNQSSASEPDLSGNDNAGTYHGGARALAALPNGDMATAFDGATQYLSIPSRPAYSIPSTQNLTWEAWIQPAVLQFSHDSDGYVDWLGKCQDYAPSCEWEARMYDTTNAEMRCNRISAYVFNPSAGLGSAADFQPVCGLIQANHFYHVVGEYTLTSAPADCTNTASYPGSIDIWVNGVRWNHASHGQTGCMSQYQVAPQAGSSPVNVGTMAQDTWFQGAIGKLAIYDYLLSSAQISAHYQAMTQSLPAGSCADSCTLN